MIKEKIGIYKLQWKSGHFYIGRSERIYERYYNHVLYLKNKKHHNKRVTRCYNKHGMPELVIVKECRHKDMVKLEKSHIVSQAGNPLCLNFYIDDITAEINYKSWVCRKSSKGIKTKKVKEPIIPDPTKKRPAKRIDLTLPKITPVITDNYRIGEMMPNGRRCPLTIKRYEREMALYGELKKFD